MQVPKLIFKSAFLDMRVEAFSLSQRQAHSTDYKWNFHDAQKTSKEQFFRQADQEKPQPCQRYIDIMITNGY